MLKESDLEIYRRPFSKDDINNLPLRRYDGDVELITSPEDLNGSIESLRRESVLGFDTETKPCFKKGQCNLPALLQLATSERVYLFQLSKMDLIDELKEVLADPAIIKTGVAVRDDVKGLQSISPFEDGGFVDLGELARGLKLKTNGLRNMAANLLGFRISKGAQRSNWGKKQLSPEQIAYAATDAWVSRELHLRMDELNML